MPAHAMQQTANKRPTTGRIVVRWVLVALMAAFIFFMSSRTAGELGTGFLAQIKLALNNAIYSTLGIAGDPMSTVAHFCEYVVLGALLVNALRSHMPLSRALVVALACASLYGVSDEIHQLFVKGRYCDVRDWITDTLGASLGVVLARLWFNSRR